VLYEKELYIDHREKDNVMLIETQNSGDSETTKREEKEKLTAGQEDQPSRLPTYRASILVADQLSSIVVKSDCI
jgi:hypothetical protein